MDNAALWGRALGYCEWKYLNMTVQLPGVWVLRGCCFHVVFSKPGPPPVRKAPLQLGSKLQRSFWEAAGGSIIVLSLPSSGRKREGRHASLIGPLGTYRAASEKHQRMTVTIKVVSSHSLSKPVLLPGKTKTHTHKKKTCFLFHLLQIMCFGDCLQLALLIYFIIMKMIGAHHLKINTLLKSLVKTVTNDPEFTTRNSQCGYGDKSLRRLPGCPRAESSGLPALQGWG